MEKSPDKQTDNLQSSEEPATDDRRGFFAKFSSIVIGGVLGLFPFASGLLVFFDPLRKKSDASGSIRVTTLDSVPDDGVARQFPVIADRTDAWNRYPNEPIGSVYLRREKGSKKIEVLNSICPHAGCLVDYDIGKSEFQCPCHNSFFKADGKRIDAHKCPSPRDLDSLEVDQEKLNQGEVWVEFKNFLTGKPQKVEKG